MGFLSCGWAVVGKNLTDIMVCQTVSLYPVAQLLVLTCCYVICYLEMIVIEICNNVSKLYIRFWFCFSFFNFGITWKLHNTYIL